MDSHRRAARGLSGRALRDDPPRHRPGDPVGGEPARRHLRAPPHRSARRRLRRQPGRVLGARPPQDARPPRRRQRRAVLRHRLRRDAARPDARHRAPLRVARRRAHRRGRRPDAGMVGDQPAPTSRASTSTTPSSTASTSTSSEPSSPSTTTASTHLPEGAPMDLGLAGAAVVVAGGTTGMGRAAADCFAADGARVAVLARSQADLDTTAAALDRARLTRRHRRLRRPLRRRVGRGRDQRDRGAVGAAERRRERRRTDGRRAEELRDLHRRRVARGDQRPHPQLGADHPGRVAVPAPGRVGTDRERVGDVDQAAVSVRWSPTPPPSPPSPASPRTSRCRSHPKGSS